MTKTFIMDDDAVDISKIPYRTLNTGDKIPGIGMGTFEDRTLLKNWQNQSEEVYELVIV